jgi:hypothetical protein
MNTHPYVGLAGVITDGKNAGAEVVIIGISTSHEEFVDGVGLYPVFVVLLPDGTHATPWVDNVKVDPVEARRRLHAIAG